MPSHPPQQRRFQLSPGSITATATAVVRTEGLVAIDRSRRTGGSIETGRHGVRSRICPGARTR